MASKRKSSEDSKQPRKLRRLSGFNIWHREFLKSADAQALSSLSEKNKVSSTKWKLLTREQRQEYNEKATRAESQTLSQKKEMRRVLSNLSNLAEHIKSNIPGCEMMFTVVKKNTHYCGGTDKGCQYLEQEAPWIPYSFMGSLAAKPGTHSLQPSKDPVEPVQPRVLVEKLFNHLYGIQVNNPGARLPYSKIQQYGILVEGLPEGKILKHPSSYGAQTLKAILAKKDSIKLKVLNPPQPKKLSRKRVKSDDSSAAGKKDEMSPPSTFLTLMTKDETVQLLSCDSASTCAAEVSDQAMPTPILCKPASADPLVVDHTYTMSLVTQNTSTETKVTLVTSRGQPVGIGSVIGGDVLHGKPIPSGYTKVAIEYIKPGTTPMFSTSFDDEELHDGQLTAWATACIKYN